MRKLLFYCLLAALCPVVVKASPQRIRPLKVGDQLPNIKITNVSNYTSTTVDLKSMSKKLVILDFWTTWCGACLDGMPHMQQLQQRFKGQLQVILVNSFKSDDSGRVNRVFNKRETYTGFKMTLPYALQQQQLAEYFPHRFVPHYVWLMDGKVVAITHQTEVTESNIAVFLAGKTSRLRIKEDIMSFDKKRPVFLDNNGGTPDQIIARSIMTGYKEGLGSSTGLHMESNGLVSRRYFINQPRLQFLRLMYSAELSVPSNRIILQTADSSLYTPQVSHGTGRYLNTVCYEIIMPPCPDSIMHRYIREDIARILKVRVTQENRLLDCLIIRCQKNDNQQDDADMRTLLEGHPAVVGIPVIFEGQGKLPAKLPLVNTSTLQQLMTVLQGAGLDVSMGRRETLVSVISAVP